MRLVKIAKAVLRSLASKKLRRRTRVKGNSRRQSFGQNYYTPAQALIDRNYGLSFKNPPAPRLGEKRAERRLAKHRERWANTPLASNKLSREA